MQPWQSVLLIISTLLIFGAGFYYDQIEKNTAIAYEESITSSPKQILVPIKNNSSFKNKEPKELQNSSAWAESNFIIEVPKKQAHLLALHKKAIKGTPFLNSTVDTLTQNPTAKELVFSPFLNDVFVEPELEIMRSLFSISQNPKIPNQLLVTVRGHTKKASEILLHMIFDNYQNLTQAETTEKPLLPNLLEQKAKILLLKENYLLLAKQIQEENEGSSVQSIEEIALNSELSQIKSELNTYVDALHEIEKIYIDGKGYGKFLNIYILANFGNVQGFLDNIEQLKRMLVNQKLESILEKEVTKNLASLEISLNQELVKGIEHVKNLSKTALSRKLELQKKLVDLELKKNNIHSLHPKFKLLKSVKSELDEKQIIFSSNYQKWTTAIKVLSLKKIN
jgi:transcriptional regulator of NAD metabolism